MKVRDLLELLELRDKDEEVVISLSSDAVHFLMGEIKATGALGLMMPLCEPSVQEEHFEGVVLWPYLLGSKTVY